MNRSKLKGLFTARAATLPLFVSAMQRICRMKYSGFFVHCVVRISLVCRCLGTMINYRCSCLQGTARLATTSRHMTSLLLLLYAHEP